jgi:hypothetical protein
MPTQRGWATNSAWARLQGLAADGGKGLPPYGGSCGRSAFPGRHTGHGPPASASGPGAAARDWRRSGGRCAGTNFRRSAFRCRRNAAGPPTALGRGCRVWRPMAARDCRPTVDRAVGRHSQAVTRGTAPPPAHPAPQRRQGIAALREVGVRVRTFVGRHSDADATRLGHQQRLGAVAGSGSRWRQGIAALREATVLWLRFLNPGTLVRSGCRGRRKKPRGFKPPGLPVARLRPIPWSSLIQPSHP